MTMVWINHTVPVWNRWWTYLPLSAKQGPLFLQTSRSWWFECPCHPFSWCSSGCWVCFHASLPISPRCKLGVMFCVFVQLEYLWWETNASGWDFYKEKEKKNSWPTVNQEGEYSFNAIKAFWLYDNCFPFFKKIFFWSPNMTAYSQAVMWQLMEKYFSILLPVSFFRDCERCRTILNTVIF